MTLPTELESYFVIALEVLQFHDPWAINFLKPFLKVPNHPHSVEQVLTAVIEYLLTEDSVTLWWLIAHQHFLAPEFCLETFAQHRMQRYLEGLGCRRGYDFRLGAHQLYLTPLSQSQLKSVCSTFEYQFLDLVLEIQVVNPSVINLALLGQNVLSSSS